MTPRPHITEEALDKSRLGFFAATPIRTTCEECGRPLGTGDRVDKGMCFRCWGACHD